MSHNADHRAEVPSRPMGSGRETRGRNLPVNLLLLAFLSYGLASATAAGANEFDPQALAQVLEKASFVVRGRPASSRIVTASSGENYRYVEFEVTEVLKGAVSGKRIEVRELAGPEQSDYDRTGEDEPNDVIVAIGARNSSDGSYTAVPGFSNGQYTVESDQDGDWVLVNPLGVDANSLSPKDVHRKVANERVPIDIFRRIAKGRDQPAAPLAGAGASVPVEPVSALRNSSRTAPASAAVPAESGSDRGQLWKAIAAVCAAIALVAWMLRKRINTSRRR